MQNAKPYEISKYLIMEAFQRVKANHGSAGIDGVSISAFEKNLKDNLYKIWNRMSSGCYFPPSVKLVEIPKPNGDQCRYLDRGPDLCAYLPDLWD
jgi:RNA-directed DNA polymerase